MGATSASERAELASGALVAAEEAAAIVSAGYRSRPRADSKQQHDLVTDFDRASQELLLRRLGALAPGIPIVAEEVLEGDSAPPPAASAGGPIWYVDPLDGTTNFVHGHPFWCVAIGLAEGGEPVVGAVVAPELGLRWLGWRGRDGSSDVRRNGAPCSVSVEAALEHSMVATGFPPIRDVAPDNNFASFESVKKAARAVRRCGSACIDLCFVADGTYDGYWERSLHVWDLVAGSALVLAAGGRVTSLDGGRPDYHTGNLVASNGRVHDALMRAIGARA